MAENTWSRDLEHVYQLLSIDVVAKYGGVHEGGSTNILGLR